MKILSTIDFPCAYARRKAPKTRGPGGLGSLFLLNIGCQMSFIAILQGFPILWAVFLHHDRHKFTRSHSGAYFSPRSTAFYSGLVCLYLGGEKRLVDPLKREIRDMLFLSIEKPPTRGGSLFIYFGGSLFRMNRMYTPRGSAEQLTHNIR